MKRINLGLSILGLAVSISSLANSNIESYAVSVPELPGAFDITGGAVYLETLDTNLEYPTLTVVAPPTVFVVDSPKTIEQEYNWGFFLGAGYTFRGTGNNLHLDWTHIETGELSGPKVESQFSNEDAIGIAQTEGQASITSDMVNLQFGQFLDIGTRLRTNLYGGLRYADFNREFADKVQFRSMPTEAVTIVTTRTDEQTSAARYQGIGPLAGIHSTFHLFNGFHFVSDFSSALLVGHTWTQGQDQYSGTATIDPDTNNFTAFAKIPTSSELRVVPALDAKLGLDYGYDFSTGFGLILSGGYQVDHYFNVFERINPSAASALAFHVFNGNTLLTFSPAPIGPRKSSDLAFQGPYLTLTAVME